MDGGLVLSGAGAERDETGGDEGKLEILFHNAKIYRLFVCRAVGATCHKIGARGRGGLIRAKDSFERIGTGEV